MAFFEKAVPVWIAGREREKNFTCGFTARIDFAPGKRVALRAAASAYYQLYVNGAFAGYGPAHCAHGFFRVDEIDLTGRLRPGENFVALEAGCTNVSAFSVLNQPGFVQAEICVDGHAAAWTAAEGGSFVGCVPGNRVQRVERYSFQRSFAEAHRLAPGWDAWRVGEISKPAVLAGQPAVRLMERGFPDFRFPELKPTALTARLRVHRDENSNWRWVNRCVDEAVPVIGGYRRDELELKLSDEVGALRTDENRPADEPWSGTLSLKDGDGAIVRFDGEKAGFPALDVRCTEKTELYLTYDEILTGDGDVDAFRLSLLGALKLQMEPGEYHFVATKIIGAQYVKLCCIGGACEVRGLRLLEAASPVPVTAKYGGGDPELKRIYDAAVESFRQNAFDVFTDCPTRERAGWTCDSFFTGRAEFALTGKNLSERLFLENYFLPKEYPCLKHGQAPMCYPSDHADHAFIPNWMMWLMLELEEYCGRTGDAAMADFAKTHVDEMLQYFAGFENERGLLEKLEGWVFIEWSKCNELTQDVNYPTNALYAGALDAMARLYSRPELSEKAARIRKTLRGCAMHGRRFVDRALRGADGTLRNGGEETETCQYYMFFFGVADPATDAALWSELRTEYSGLRAERENETQMYPANAFIGKALRMLLLDRYGLKEELIAELRAVYAPMAALTGTLWENLTTCASCNHGFASIIGQLLLKNA